MAPAGLIIKWDIGVCLVERWGILRLQQNGCPAVPDLVKPEDDQSHGCNDAQHLIRLPVDIAGQVEEDNQRGQRTDPYAIEAENKTDRHP